MKRPGESVTADRARRFFSRQNEAAVVLWAAGTLAVASMLPIRRWSHAGFIALVLCGCCGVAAALVRATIGDRLPRWTFHVDVVSANVLVTIVTLIGRTRHVHMANMYLLVMVFAVLFLPPTLGLLHLASAAAGYAIAIAVTPSAGDPEIVEWLSIVGTAFVVGGVLHGLVTVLRSAAMEDPTTGLANRRAWGDHLDQELQRAKRSMAPLSVAIIDLNGFKAVNDRLGHDAGDALLRSLSEAWLGVARGSGDLIARIGGDEFGILAVGAAEDGILAFVDRLRSVTPEGVSWSVGVATWDTEETAESMVRRADQLMYHAKQEHRRLERT